MTDWKIKYTHRTPGKELEVLTVYDYFGAGQWGYKLPSGEVLREEKFKQLYEKSDVQ